MSKKFNIKWRQVDNDELSRQVKNFNAKRTRILKKFPTMEEYLPAKMSVKELKKNIDTRQDFNRIVKSLNRFTQKGAEEPIITKQGIKTTKYEIKETSIKVATINRRKTAERKKANVSTEKGTMGTIANNNLLPKKFNIDKIQPHEWDKFTESVEKQVKSTYTSDKMKAYKDNYIQALNNAFGSKADNIIDIVNNLNGETLVQMLYDNPILQIDFIYDPLEVSVKVEAIETNMLDYIENLNL